MYLAKAERNEPGIEQERMHFTACFTSKDSGNERRRGAACRRRWLIPQARNNKKSFPVF